MSLFTKMKKKALRCQPWCQDCLCKESSCAISWCAIEAPCLTQASRWHTPCDHINTCGKVCLQIVDANILKQYIFQKGFITESAKLKREQEAASSTLQVCSTDHSASVFCVCI